MVRPASIAVVLCLAALGLCACETLPGTWDVVSAKVAANWPDRLAWARARARTPAQADKAAPAMDFMSPEAIPVVSQMEDEHIMRLDMLGSDVARLRRQLAEALKENARLKKELDETKEDNTLLKDLAAKKGR